MKKSIPALIAVSALSVTLLAACSSSDSTESTTTETAATSAAAADSASTELRDDRYCEIIPVTRDGVTVTSTVYNTLGLNDCPEDIWPTITEDMVNEQYGSIQAKLNGPRFWMMDQIIGSGDSVDTPYFTFGTEGGGIEMQQRAVIETKANEDTVGDQTYVPNQVQRDTVFVFNAGEPVFELTDPDGHVYMMQSYSQIVDPNLSYDQLADLGSTLQLPEGWSYSTRTLDEEYQLSTASTDGIAYVVNDDLMNSYQRAS